MAKYSYEFKRKVVEEYLNGQGGYGYLAKTNDIKNHETIRRWVNAYQTLGDEGLLRSRRNKDYSIDFKLEVVQSYLTSEVSYQSLANQYGINNPDLLTRWVLDYRKYGIDGLLPKQRGRPPKMSKKESKTKKTQPFTHDAAQRLKELEEENYKLRMENDILKKFRRLRLEKTKQQTKNSQD
ncbi:helix-turn-helix domain-containing protein [Eremococcus coleocola]|uniref:helix-turn-helix domain-containing protein n=1 Tax=Eremococcus coleocola TaxID=88132 RepID=UPI00040E094D|nr:helix-turn-helix domain-containing protein [Eremococcus coleocola]